MRFSVAAAITMAAGAFAGVVTETVTDYTTYCPEATSIVHGGSTYSVPSVCSPSAQCLMKHWRNVDAMITAHLWVSLSSSSSSSINLSTSIFKVHH